LTFPVGWPLSPTLARSTFIPKMTIWTDTSKDALSKVSEDHYFDSFTCFAAVPGVEVYEGNEMIRVVSPGIPNGLTNTIVRCRLSAGNADAVIDETLAYFRARDVIPYWRLCPGDLPVDLEERLVRKGFVLAEEQPAMAADLARLNEHVPMPNGLTIERVTNEAAMQARHGWLRRLGEDNPFGRLLLGLWRAGGFGPDSAWQHYLGYLNGETVSWASLFYATGVAGIYAVGTMPSARRQGIGSAITLRALLDARRRGYRVGLLQSSTIGYSVYRKLGFETCFTIKTYKPAGPRI
jgi:ribosomal protein S18 acetylase RimI-like enzyme